MIFFFSADDASSSSAASWALTTEGEVPLELNLAFNAADGRPHPLPCGFRLGGRLLLFPDLTVQAITSLPYMMPGRLT